MWFGGVNRDGRVTLLVQIPGLAVLRLEHLLVDVNGTLTNRGELLDGVEARLGRLSSRLGIRLVSADTFGTLNTIAAGMNVSAVRASTGEDKLRFLNESAVRVARSSATDRMTHPSSRRPRWDLPLSGRRVRAPPLCGRPTSCARQRPTPSTFSSTQRRFPQRCGPSGARANGQRAGDNSQRRSVCANHWCHSCYGITPRSSGPCVRCGRPVEGPPGRSFDEQLVWALGHPDGDRAVVEARRSECVGSGPRFRLCGKWLMRIGTPISRLRLCVVRSRSRGARNCETGWRT